MIPIRDNLPTRRFPFVCVALIVANVIVFLTDQATGGYVQGGLVRTPFGLQRSLHFVGGLSAQFALVPRDLVSDPNTAWITVFASMFLHANWLHVGSNMLYLWIFGNNIEDTLGRVGFLLFYLTCGVGAAALQVFADPSSIVPMVGASGAIAGIMGAYLILFPRTSILTIVPLFFIFFAELPAYIVIGFWALLNIVNSNLLGGGGLLSPSGGVAYAAHVGGFATGLVMILILGGNRLARDRRRGLRII